MIVLRRQMDALSRLSLTRIHNLNVVRKAPVSLARRLSSDSPMTAGALRVLGVCREIQMLTEVSNWRGTGKGFAAGAWAL
jgi:hypothetical protein